jgi:hypothetical protein
VLQCSDVRVGSKLDMRKRSSDVRSYSNIRSLAFKSRQLMRRRESGVASFRLSCRARALSGDAVRNKTTVERAEDVVCYYQALANAPQ